MVQHEWHGPNEITFHTALVYNGFAPTKGFEDRIFQNWLVMALAGTTKFREFAHEHFAVWCASQEFETMTFEMGCSQLFKIA